MSTLTAVGSYQAIRKEGPTLVAEADALTGRIQDFLTKTAPLATAQLPSKALFQNLEHENPESAAAAQTQANELASLKLKGKGLTEAFKILQLDLTKFQSAYTTADGFKRLETEDVEVADVETNDTVFSAAKTAFDASQNTAPKQLKAAQETAAAAAEFVARVNSGEDEVNPETAEASLTKWQEAANALAPYILELKETQAKLGADRIPQANETPEDRERLATLDQTFAAEHERNFAKTNEHRTQLDEWKITLGNQLGELEVAHATLQSSLIAIGGIKANNWQRVPGYIESAGGVLGAIGGIVTAPAAALVNALSSSQLDQYQTQAQKLSDQIGAMNRKIADAEEGSLIHEDLDAELATFTAALAALESDLARLEETDREGLSKGFGELKNMHQELLATQKSGWKKPAESTLYTRIFGK